MFELLQAFSKLENPLPLVVQGAQSRQIIDDLSQLILNTSSKFHPDKIVFETLEEKLDDLRQKLYQLQLKPLQSPRKLLCLYDFERASPQIQNALLKTLEEPHSAWVILIGSSGFNSLLPTIRSRCLVYSPEKMESEIGLSEEEEKIYQAVSLANDAPVNSILEKQFKQRKNFRSSLKRVLEFASQKQYPGQWKRFAFYIHESLFLLDRNQHPKIVWEWMWGQATNETH